MDISKLSTEEKEAVYNKLKAWKDGEEHKRFATMVDAKKDFKNRCFVMMDDDERPWRYYYVLSEQSRDYVTVEAFMIEVDMSYATSEVFGAVKCRKFAPEAQYTLGTFRSVCASDLQCSNVKEISAEEFRKAYLKHIAKVADLMIKGYFGYANSTAAEAALRKLEEAKYEQSNKQL